MNILPRKTVKIILIVEQSNNGRTNRVERLRILLTFESHYAHMLILGCLNFVSLGHRLVFSVDVISLFFLKKFSFTDLKQIIISYHAVPASLAGCYKLWSVRSAVGNYREIPGKKLQQSFSLQQKRSNVGRMHTTFSCLMPSAMNCTARLHSKCSSAKFDLVAVKMPDLGATQTPQLACRLVATVSCSLLIIFSRSRRRMQQRSDGKKLIGCIIDCDCW